MQFAQRYARVFTGVDPLDVLERDEAKLPMMQRLYASAVADLEEQVSNDITIDAEGE